MPIRPLKIGPKGKVCLWAPRENGLLPTSLCPHVVPKDDFVNIIRSAEIFVKTGAFPLDDRKFKKVADIDGVFTIKAFQTRLYGGFFGSDFVVVLCLKKTSDRLSREEIKKIQKAWTACKEGGGA